MSETDGTEDRLATTDHDTIREWAEERGARPAKVEAAGRDPETEADLRLQFPDRDASDERTTPTSWDKFFEAFDAEGLVFVAPNDEDDGGGGGRYDIVPVEGIDEEDADEDVREAARERREAKEDAERRQREREVEQLSEERADEAADDANLDNHRDEEPFGS